MVNGVKGQNEDLKISAENHAIHNFAILSIPAIFAT